MIPVMSQVITEAGSSLLSGAFVWVAMGASTPPPYNGVQVYLSTWLPMKLTTLSVPTARLAELGMFPARFFRHNASLEVLQAFRLGGGDLTLLVRIQRKGRGPPEREVERQGAELRERYGLRHFELLSSDPQAREYTVLLRVSMTEGVGGMAHRRDRGGLQSRGEQAAALRRTEDPRELARRRHLTRAPARPVQPGLRRRG